MFNLNYQKVFDNDTIANIPIISSKIILKTKYFDYTLEDFLRAKHQNIWVLNYDPGALFS